MGWNGGVSLAVWMGGVAVELDEARRKAPTSRAARRRPATPRRFYQAPLYGIQPAPASSTSSRVPAPAVSTARSSPVQLRTGDP